MFIEKFSLPSKDTEMDYYLSGASTIYIRGKRPGTFPFGIFPKLILSDIDLSNVTLLCGSSNTPKVLLLHIIAAKLGIDHSSFLYDYRCFEDYLSFCSVKYKDINNKDFSSEFIGREKCVSYLSENMQSFKDNTKWSAVKFFESRFEENALYILEDPETGMSLKETEELASLISDFSRYSGAQFIISTNAPSILKIKGALIYDFDILPVSPRIWRDWSALKEYSELLNTKK